MDDYLDAIGRLKGATFKDAVSYYLERHPSGLQSRTVQQVVDELIEAKRRARKSEKHLKDLDSRLGMFAHAFSCPITSVTGGLLQQWLDAMKTTNRTKVNHLRLVRLLFGFAIRKKYLPRKAIHEVTDVEKPEAEDTEIETFTPDELRELFRHARPEMIPWLAISAFAGVRNVELSRLDWRNVNLRGGQWNCAESQREPMFAPP